MKRICSVSYSCLFAVVAACGSDDSDSPQEEDVVASVSGGAAPTTDTQSSSQSGAGSAGSDATAQAGAGSSGQAGQAASSVPTDPVTQPEAAGQAGDSASAAGSSGEPTNTAGAASQTPTQPNQNDGGVVTLPPDAGDKVPDASGWGVAGGVQYLEILRGGATQDQAVPMIVLIHSLAQKAELHWVDCAAPGLQADTPCGFDVDPGIPVRIVMPQATTPYGSGFSWFPYDTNPDTRNDAAIAPGIQEAGERVARFIQVVRGQRPARGRVIVTGFSQGAMLTYQVTLKHPELVYFAAPASGYLPQDLWPSAAPGGQLPEIDAIHGTSDKVVDFDADSKLIQHLQGLGYTAEFTSFGGVAHEVSSAMSAHLQQALSEAVQAL
jgi:phospholipase/carboxylesterase